MDPNDKPTVPPVVAPAQDYSQAPSLQKPAPPPGFTPSDMLGGMIPTGNPASLIAYYCSIAGLLPCLAPICAPIAIIKGRQGLAAHRENPAIAGRTHSLVGIILGTLDLVLLLGIVLIFVIAVNSH